MKVQVSFSRFLAQLLSANTSCLSLNTSKVAGAVTLASFVFCNHIYKPVFSFTFALSTSTLASSSKDALTNTSFYCIYSTHSHSTLHPYERDVQHQSPTVHYYVTVQHRRPNEC